MYRETIPALKAIICLSEISMNEFVFKEAHFEVHFLHSSGTHAPLFYDHVPTKSHFYRIE